MRVVGLVSGGKDSCYNLLQCIAAGHQIVALANLEPRHGDEIDSYMYQSVGHMGIDLFAEAIGLPLVRRKIQGKSLNVGDINYSPTEGDEVEDLYWLLKQVKEEHNVEGVGVGAVLSEYQRVRVENVCERLGLVSLAYMWRRDQTELLQEMVDCGLEAIIIKVATYGLTPEKHLGKTIKEMQPYLEKMKDKYHMNVCGEGGEYETFTLDCPIFRKKIVLKDADQVLSSGDVGYLNFREMELLDKEIPEDVSHWDLVQQTGVRSPYDFLVDLNLAAEEQQAEEQAKQLYEERKAVESCSNDEISNGMKENANLLANGEVNVDAAVPQVTEFASRVSASSRSISTISGFVWCGSHSAQQMDDVMAQIKETLAANGMEARHVVSVRMFIKNMHNYSSLNADYVKHFSANPPVRVCVEAPLPPDVQVQIDLTSWKQSRYIAVDQDTVHVPNRTTMHVQGISHWAPANIGPYSQGVKIGNVILLAGMIGLVPGTMELVTGGVEMEARLSLRHVSRVIAALSPGSDIRCVVQGVCFLANLRDVGLARRMMARVSESQISTYVVVPKLPRGALIEWQTWAFVGNQRFDYEERGYTSGNVSVRMRRRWSHDNTVCAIITNASAERGVDMNVEILEELIRYTLSKAPSVDLTIPDTEDKELSIEKQSTAVCLTAYYKVGELPLKQLQKALDAALPKDSAAVSYVPVLAIEDKSVLLSLTAIRH